MSTLVVTGDAERALRGMARGSAQACITSPPYFGLRSYLPADHADKAREVGIEASLDEYLGRLVRIFRLVGRVLRDDGTLWVILGDTYAGGGHGGPVTGCTLLGSRRNMAAARKAKRQPVPRGLKKKDLIGVPWRFAFAMQKAGWILRSDIIWHKESPMPESVNDRPTKAHEYAFLFAKQGAYFYDKVAIYEPFASTGERRVIPARQQRERRRGALAGNMKPPNGYVPHENGGRNKRSVWTVAPEPYDGEHTASCPSALVAPMILAGTSAAGGCSKCGAPLERIVKREKIERAGDVMRHPGGGPFVQHGMERTGLSHMKYAEWLKDHPEHTAGWRPTCKCVAGTEPQLVLDPFCGEKCTTGMVSKELGRSFIGVELHPDYASRARERLGSRQIESLLPAAPEQQQRLW